MGYNGAPAGMPHCTVLDCYLGPDGGCIRTVHAEANAISFAARYGIATQGTTIYITFEPCFNCAKLILNAGIIEVVCGGSPGDYRDQNGVDLLQEANIPLRYLGKVNFDANSNTSTTDNYTRTTLTNPRTDPYCGRPTSKYL
jgi:dCMP deaminase